MFELEPLEVLRVVADPAALDGAPWPADDVLRVAPDEAMVVGGQPADLNDHHAIQIRDTSWLAAELQPSAAAALMEQAASWRLPPEGFAQGMIAGLPVKVIVGSSVRFLVQRMVALELADRVHHLDFGAAR